MKKLMGSLALGVILIGCGKTRHIGPAPAEPVNPRERNQCAAVAVPSHRIQIGSAAAIPTKVIVTVDGVLKYDECLDPPAASIDPSAPPAPTVSVERGSPGRLDIVVIHGKAYPNELPKQVSVDIKDRGDCKDAAVPWFEAADLALDFKRDQPAGAECGDRVLAIVERSQ